ncbi:unknown [Azospirillum sp. CAG:239]|nr:unknown [Azospirillum sp. CAG:239]
MRTGLGGLFQRFFHRQIHFVILFHGHVVKNSGGSNQMLKRLLIALGQISVSGEVFVNQFNRAGFVRENIIKKIFADIQFITVNFHFLLSPEF